MRQYLEEDHEDEKLYDGFGKMSFLRFKKIKKQCMPMHIKVLTLGLFGKQMEFIDPDFDLQIR